MIDSLPHRKSDRTVSKSESRHHFRCFIKPPPSNPKWRHDPPDLRQEPGRICSTTSKGTWLKSSDHLWWLVGHDPSHAFVVELRNRFPQQGVEAPTAAALSNVGSNPAVPSSFSGQLNYPSVYNYEAESVESGNSIWKLGVEKLPQH